MQYNRFGDQLKQSQGDSLLPFWDDLYRELWGDKFAGSIVVAGEGDKARVLQRLCVDRVVILTDGTAWTIEEKLRKQDWPDILLEYLSVKEQGKVGWAVNDACISRILVYGKQPTGEFYLFPLGNCGPRLKPTRRSGQRSTAIGMPGMRGM